MFKQNTYHDYLIALIYFIVGIAIVRILSYVFGKLHYWVKRKDVKLDLIPIIRAKIFPLLYFSVFYYSVNRLILHVIISKIVYYMGLILAVFYGVTLLQKLVVQWMNKYWGKSLKEDSKIQLFEAVVLAVKVTIWIIAGLIILDNIGIEISGLIAGLGIGGIAIAFAAQAILEDIFSYFIIFFDRPFEIGDFISIGEYLGAVEHIGLKTTRIRSLGGEQLIFSNKDLINSRVKNYKRMKTRRILFNFGVVYQTSLDKLKKIQGIVRDIINEQNLIDFDRCHFKSYGDYALVFEVVYYVNDRDYNIYMDINHQILLRIKEEFQKEGISFAYPTQSLYLHREINQNEPIQTEEQEIAKDMDEIS
ncbi:MAG: mechanosensitive ion channel family protein [Halanaerobiales bacterium]